MAKLISCIEVELTVGDGTETNPSRNVRQIWSADGQLIAERDTWAMDQLAQILRKNGASPARDQAVTVPARLAWAFVRY